MKRSASKAESSSEQKEPLENPVDKSDAVGDSDVVVESDAIEPTQAGLGLEPQRVQEQGNAGEGSVQAVGGAALQSTQAGLVLESFQDVERGAIQANSGANNGVAVQPPTQAGLELESHSFQEQQQNVEEETILAGSGVAVQPTQADLRLESHSFQEQPKIEEGAIQANCGVAVQPTQAGFRLESHSFQGQPNVEEGAIQAVQPKQAGLGLESHSFQEQPNVEERFILANADLPNPSNLEAISVVDLFDILHPLGEESDILDEILQITTGQVEESHQENEDRTVPQAPPSDMDNLRIGQVEASHQEEEAGINDRTVPQAPPSDTNNLRNDGWIELADLEEPIDGEDDTGIQAQAGRQQMQDEPPPQGTAGRRIRLQVPLCDAKWLSEPKCVSIASSERTCMCGGMSLEQEAMSSCSLSQAFQSILNVTCQLNPAEFLQTDLLHGDATGSSARVTMREEGDTKGPLCAEGLISCATKSDNPDVAQQTAHDVSRSSSTSLVHLLLGLLGEACILPAFAADLSKGTEEEMKFGSEDRFNGRGCSDTELEGRQSSVSHVNNTRPYLQQRMTSIKVAKTQHELAQAVSNEERGMGRACGLAPCLFWIATLALILLCLFRSLYRLTRAALTSV